MMSKAVSMWVCPFVMLAAIFHDASALAPPKTVSQQTQQQQHAAVHETRRQVLRTVTASWIVAATTTGTPAQSEAKCTDIESCREIGEKKVEQDLSDNPVIPLANGVRYKLLKPGYGDKTVEKGSTIDLIYVVNTPARYMFSQGFGLEKIDTGFGQKQTDLGIGSYLVTLGTKHLPIGIEDALIGMKKGERRKVEVPPSVGFDTSDWKPAASTPAGKAVVENYKKLIRGSGPNNPPFAAPTIWQIEVLSIR
uniref:peptidylprolyl isomerase n=1 Tax=Craspedostauros australis TaxID=1486917 RepID=A0A7R9ZKT2_9STRA|mmetsp:Transcript_18709/g.52038  ORF Transcript_18709/g.52038 Transcript_18709/m.52038 type:complete len:251 (+) Transcript_18709:1496-2248(+)|eukprot:CAMPEP_0198112202 /NCGR_PEP_ID=MMETSP1442-20131203/4082_1 /TAXON_ID= /ORGANISM="Craspedostauros australis, Strain CCMP3328" /LENGTH=250 /DNA_ID=CAMNT_0043768897 /DNA_START=1490 /DNA_END=2242 /DNA_ORIENTATION=-